MDLDGILRVFEVRSVTPERPSLTICSQIELAMHADVAMPDAPRDVSNASIVTSDIRHDMLRGPEDVGVSVPHIMTVTK